MTNYENLRYKKQKEYIKKLKRQIKDVEEQKSHFVKMCINTQDKLNIANKTVHDLMKHSEMQERHQQMTEKALEKEWIIISYLEDRQVKLIQAMAE